MASVKVHILTTPTKQGRPENPVWRCDMMLDDSSIVQARFFGTEQNVMQKLTEKDYFMLRNVDFKTYDNIGYLKMTTKTQVSELDLAVQTFSSILK